MKTVIEMAREAGLVGGPVYARGLERFAELVRAAAIKEAPDYLMGYADGVHAERKQIAQMIEDAPPLIPFAQNDHGGCTVCGFTPKLAAKAIRARSET